MKRRHVKKLVQRVAREKDMRPYRAAMRGGSQKLDRRRAALFRWGSGGEAWDRSRRLSMRIAQAMGAEIRDVTEALLVALQITADLHAETSRLAAVPEEAGHAVPRGR